jgi:hypothetical protein
MKVQPLLRHNGRGQTVLSSGRCNSEKDRRNVAADPLCKLGEQQTYPPPPNTVHKCHLASTSFTATFNDAVSTENVIYVALTRSGRVSAD